MHYDRCFAEIDLEAIKFNMDGMHKIISKDTKMVAVIKANGYGHGAVAVAKKLEPLEYLWGFAVASYEEAHELRENEIKKPILILGYSFPYCYEDLIKENIRPAVFRSDSLKELSFAAKKIGRCVKIHIAVDTAMSRIGVFCDKNGEEFFEEAYKTEGIEIEGVFTHFSKADEDDPSNTYAQIKSFNDFVSRVEKRLDITIPIKHSSNSAGILFFREANMNMVRAGITMYGLLPSEKASHADIKLKPAMSLYSHVIYVKEVPEGTPVSYGGGFVTDKPTRIATVPIGYADGYARSLSNKGYVLIRGQKAKILGRVCMDQLMADVTDIEGICEGDKVTVIGRDGDNAISMEELGRLSGRFNYEFVCCIGQRVPRVYI